MENSDLGTRRVTQIILRPHLDAFLKEMKEKFNLIVYTAGTRDYAQPILDFID